LFCLSIELSRYSEIANGFNGHSCFGVSNSSGLAAVVVVCLAGCACVVVFTSAGGVTVVSVVFGGLYQETALLICSSVYHFLSNSEYSGKSLILAIGSTVGTVCVVCGNTVGVPVGIVGCVVVFVATLGSILVYFETSVPALTCALYAVLVIFLPVESVYA
jgi:hypothetical protein